MTNDESTDGKDRSEYETDDSMGDDPAESLQEYKKHAENVAKLEQLLEQVDGLADSMTASYDDETELGKVTLYLEFYEDEEQPVDTDTDRSEGDSDG